MRPTKAVALFDGTSAANTAFDTGNLDTSDYDSLLVEVIPSGAAAASTLSLYDTAYSTTTAIRALATPATAAVKTAAWGSGENPAASNEYVGGQPGALPANVRVGVGALGAGVTARIRVIGRRLFKGVEGAAHGLAPSYRDPNTGTASHTEV